MGKIADTLHARGELDEVLRIRRDEQLPILERLGDARATAITKGGIADVLQTRGELDEALRIRREEELPVFERLGDTLGRAMAMYKITLVLLAKEGLTQENATAMQDALAESFTIAKRLDDPYAIAHVGLELARTLATLDQQEVALDVLADTRSAFERIGSEEGHSQAEDLGREIALTASS